MRIVLEVEKVSRQRGIPGAIIELGRAGGTQPDAETSVGIFTLGVFMESDIARFSIGKAFCVELTAVKQ